MRRGQFATVILGSLAAAVLGGAGFAVAQEASVKQKMLENFAGMQIVLGSLMTANYGAAPAPIDVITEHATYLMHSVPDSAKEDRDQFLAYAYSLQGHAKDLKSIIDRLIEQDAAARASGKPLERNDLREAAAAHYGGMVTTCVTCHNRFRLQTVQ